MKFLAAAVLVGAVVVSASFAHAQGSQGGNQALNDQTKTLGMPGQDEDWMKNALDQANAEHTLSELASAKATDPDVKSAAQKMTDSSADSIKRLLAYAPSLAVKPPKDLTSKWKKERDKLNGMSGADFDKAYVKDMVSLHHDIINNNRSEAANSHQQTYQDVAKGIADTETAHSTELKTLQSKVGK